MLELTILERMLVALALGALVGLEREYATHKHHGYSFAGIRTFPLIALMGALAAYFGEVISIWILIISIAVLGIIIVIAYFTFSEHSRHIAGATSEIAGFLIFFIGILCYHNEINLAIILTVVMTVILYARSFLHHLAEKISKQEMADTIKFAVIAFVILPLLPNKAYGPYEVFNPYNIWLTVVLVSGVSFVGYIALKWLGDKGIALAGLMGGLASSTALTVGFSQRSKNELTIYRALALGVILANIVAMGRVIFWAGIINKNLLPHIIIVFSILMGISLAFSYWLWKTSIKTHGHVELTSPFTLGPALKFALFFTTILALTKIASVYLSNSGFYVLSTLSGFADVDSITISISQLSKNGLALEVAENGIILGVIANLFTKGGIAYFIGGKKFARIIIGFYLFLAVVAGTLIFLI
jgi:uncharacterized membrane protein (DUF4010 family)